MEKFVLFSVYIALFYLCIGLIFSILFYRKGMSKIDEIAKDSTLGFKLVVFPGVVIFWPLLLSKWTKQN